MLNSDTVELRWILNVIWRRFWVVILMLILALAATAAIFKFVIPVYDATVVLYVQPSSDPSTNSYNLIMAGQQLAVTYGQMLNGPSVMQSVISKLGLNETPDSLAKKVSVVPVKDTQLITITVTDKSPNQASLLANTIADIFISQVQNLQIQKYTETIKSVQDKLDVEKKAIIDIQANIDTLNAKNSNLDVELNRQQLLLNDLRSDYRNLQQKQQSLDLALTQLPDSIKIVEEAQVSPSNPLQTIVTVMVGQPPAAVGTDFAMTQSPDQMALTFSQIVTASPVLDATIKDLNLTLANDQLSAMVTVKPVAGTPLIELIIVSPLSNNQKLAIANSLAKNFIAQAQVMIATPYNNRLSNIMGQENTLLASIDQAQTEITSITAAKVQGETDLSRLNNDLTNHISTSRTLQTNYDQLISTSSNLMDTVVITEKATPPKFATDHRLLYYLITLLLALVIGVALIFLLEQLDDRIRTRQDLKSILDLSSLGTIRKFGWKSSKLVMETDPTSIIAEDFRILVANIRLVKPDQPLHKILVTSPKSEDCKSIISANLAITFAQAGLNVIVLDGDLRFPRLNKIFNCEPKIGISEALLSGKVEDALLPTRTKGLRVLATGHIPSEPSVILNSTRLGNLIDELAQKVDIVVIDSPAILAAADTAILSTLADGVVLVTQSGHTSNQDGKEAISRLRQANTQILGGILYAVYGRSDQYSTNVRKVRFQEKKITFKQVSLPISRFFRRVWKHTREYIPIQSFRGRNSG